MAPYSVAAPGSFCERDIMAPLLRARSIKNIDFWKKIPQWVAPGGRRGSSLLQARLSRACGPCLQGSHRVDVDRSMDIYTSHRDHDVAAHRGEGPPRGTTSATWHGAGAHISFNGSV